MKRESSQPDAATQDLWAPGRITIALPGDLVAPASATHSASKLSVFPGATGRYIWWPPFSEDPPTRWSEENGLRKNAALACLLGSSVARSRPSF